MCVPKKRDLVFAVATALLVISALSSLSRCEAQVVTATLTGTVTDPTGASVPEAALTATNVATQVAAKTTSDDNGNYTLPRLGPGTYTITIEKSGFQTKVLSGIELLVNQNASLNISLNVGDVNVKVEVSGAAPLVDTNTASVGTVINQRELQEMPLNLRRFTSLALLVPGTVMSQGGYGTTFAGGSHFSETTYSANGGRDASNLLLIDGMESRAYGTGGFALAPPPDAVQEFKIQTNVYSAAFGKTSGSTINTVTKSGTNEFHGNAYEFLRNDILDARNFFATSKPEYRRNQFGATGGGPIVKNKTFVFGFYDALRQIQGLTLGNIVPTDAQKAGNFSSVLTGQQLNLCGAGGPANLNFDSGQLFNPATESLFTCPAGSGKAGQQILVGQPVPGNVIANIDPVARKVLPYFPGPNRNGTPNYINSQPNVRYDHQFGVRVDQIIGDKDQIYGRYLFGQSTIDNPAGGYFTLPGFGDHLFFRGHNVAVQWTHTINPNLLNEARLGFQKNWEIDSCEACPRGQGFTEGFGIKNLHALDTSSEGFPAFSLANFSGIGDAGYRPATGPDMVEKYEDALTWVRGRHNVVVGADLQWWQSFRQENPYLPRGQISFNGQYSSLGDAIPGVAAVQDLADFELGYPSNAGRTLRYKDNNLAGGTFTNLYAQDDIKLTPNLSINLGLRWEFRRPPLDKRDNIVMFVPTGPKFSGPGNGALITAANDALNDSYCTDPQYSYLIGPSGHCVVASSAVRARLGFTGRTRRTLVFPTYTDFAPRIGIAWRPFGSNKFTIRTGYGIFYDLPNLNTMQFISGNPINAPASQFITTLGEPPVLTSGAPTTTESVFATPNVPNISQLYGALWVTPHFRYPRIQEWSFGIQTQFAQNWAADISYIGMHGTQLSYAHLNGNQPAPGPGDPQSRRPYPDFNRLAYFSSDASSVYDSLQTKLSKRFSNGVSLLAAYTLAKSLDNNEGNEGSYDATGGNVGPPDDNNPFTNVRGRAVNDVRHRVVFSYVWELPFGKGKSFFNWGRVPNAILGGWELSGIYTAQSGFPFTVLAPDFSNTGSYSARPDRVCNGAGPKTLSQWFDTSCFTIDALQTAYNTGIYRFGNSGRNILDGPGLQEWDSALIKNFGFRERYRVQFRAEAFNVLNHANFGFPGNVVHSATYGQITSAGAPRDIQFGLKISF